MNEAALRLVCFLAASLAGGALLLSLYGLVPLRYGTVYAFVPAVVVAGVMLLVDHRRRSALTGMGEDGLSSGAMRRSLWAGMLGGLLGTLAYDLVRVPFLLLGFRIFAPISAYGVWIADASHSSWFTETLGWSYHFSNGLTFGVMYAMTVRRGRVWLAVVWALLLETIAIASPWGEIFGLRSNPTGIAIAYLGHVAYGLPLGFCVARLADPGRRMPRAVTVLGSAAFGACTLPLAAAPLIQAPRVDPAFSIEGVRLRPDWIRIVRRSAIRIESPRAERVLRVPAMHVRQAIERGESIEVAFPHPGVFQVFLESTSRTQSSFVIVEPVHEAQTQELSR